MRRSDGPPRILSPEDIRNAQFGTTRMRAGYDMDDVDDFLDRVEASLAALLAEVRRAQEAETLLRQQYEQLQARSGGSPYSSTAVQRPLTPQPGVAVGSADVEQALAQAAAVRQGLIAQLRSHVAQVNAQIQAVAATMVEAPGTPPGATAPLATSPITAAPGATPPMSTGPLPRSAAPTGPVPSVAPAAQSPQTSPSLRSTEETGPLPNWSAPTQEIPRIVD